MTKLRKAAVAALVCAAAALPLSACSSMNQQWHEGCVVEAKDRIMQNGTDSEKRVITSCGVFSVNDSLAGGHNSYDTFVKLKEGRKYDLKTGDYRVGFLSTFENIIEIKEVPN